MKKTLETFSGFSTRVANGLDRAIIHRSFDSILALVMVCVVSLVGLFFAFVCINLLLGG